MKVLGKFGQLKRLSLILMLTLFTVLIGGCQKQDSRKDPLRLYREDGTVITDTLQMELGESQRLHLSLDSGEFHIDSVSTSERPVAFVAWMDGGLTVRAEQTGSTQVTLALTSKNLGTTSVTLELQVLLPKLPLSVSLSKGAPADAVFSDGQLTIGQGESAALLLSLPQNTQLSLGEQAGSSADGKLIGNQLWVTGRSLGETEITLEALAEGYEPATVKIPVQVVARPLKVTLSGEELGPDGLLFEAGRPSSVKVSSMPQFDRVQAVSDNPGIEVEVKGSTLTFSAKEETSGTVTITVFKAGYEPAKTTLKVEATNTMAPLRLVSKEAGELRNLSVPIGETEEIYLLYDDAAQVTVNCDSDAVDVIPSGKSLFIRGVKSGEANIQITVEEEGYHENVVILHVTVPNPALELTASQNAVETSVGHMATVSLTCNQENAFLRVSLSRGIARVSIRDGVLTVDPLEEGDAVILITASVDGWESATLSIPLTVLKPKVKLSADKTEITAAVGQSEAVLFDCDPPDATIEVSVAQRIATVYYQDGKLIVEPLEPGKTTVTVTALKAGYEADVLELPLSIAPLQNPEE